MKKHLHYEIIRAYADGEEIQLLSSSTGNWVDIEFPSFRNNIEYRIKAPISEKAALMLEVQELMKRVKRLEK